MQRYSKIALSTLVVTVCLLFLAVLEVRPPSESFRPSQHLSTLSSVIKNAGQGHGQGHGHPHGRPKTSSGTTSTTSTSSKKYAYATFFSGPLNDTRKDDKYFTAARVLTYQLLHHPDTRTTNNYPLLVLTPHHVDAHKTDVLEREGATVIRTDVLNAENDWVHPARESWAEQFTKLRLFTMTEYERILFIDLDMLLTRSMDPIFDEDVVRNIAHTRSRDTKDDEAPLPEDYVFVGVADAGGPHDEKPSQGDYVNGGFWLMRPDTVLYDHYVSVMNTPGRFDDSVMEQGLLNYAHRSDGPMPHRMFPVGKWNINWPSYGDVQRGAASVHDKFWDPDNADWIDRKLVEMWWRMQGEMEGFWLKAQQDGTY
ncbi:hypothetical protein PV11_03227 [Exophiala sideris]|uniref:Nucleotide-diphospho-sugar transferase n=1 Tax=Exophiala sideris TaxID=1016849 RepID=A0A0D1YYL4_9EURO|nr:hypothetical protein PV11_03227 [Exophiala sideris]